LISVPENFTKIKPIDITQAEISIDPDYPDYNKNTDAILKKLKLKPEEKIIIFFSDSEGALCHDSKKIKTWNQEFSHLIYTENQSVPQLWFKWKNRKLFVYSNKEMSNINVTWIGDINGDGIPDFIIETNNHDLADKENAIPDTTIYSPYCDLTSLLLSKPDFTWDLYGYDGHCGE